MKFVSITKPGIIFGNIITVTGGFLLASHEHFNVWLFIATLLGMSLIIACGCVVNNYYDRDIDSLMQRTKNRVMVQNQMSITVAMSYAAVLGVLGFLLLSLFTNFLTVIVAFIGLFFYVLVYTLWLKRRSIYGTIIGGIAGAVPPVVGYCAVTNRIDMGAILLFLILFLWQIPHFYAISIRRLDDYKAAAIPILPVQRNIEYTKVSMLLYIVAFTVVAVLPTIFGYAGLVYFITALCFGLVWFVLGLMGMVTKDDNTWARRMFSFSILNIMVLCFVMAVPY